MKKIKILIPCLTLLTSLPSVSLASCQHTSDDVYNTLTKLKDVVKVEKIDVDFSDRKVYDLWFEQPLDWNNKAAGSFLQRVRFSFAGYDAINEMFVRGYQLQDLVQNRYNDLETASHYNGNTLRPEYRFFGDSCPSDISDYSLKYWDYLTVENAANDFHHIIESFKESFSGKWIMAGASKGGFTTNVQAMLHPQDADAYVSYVAPRANDPAEQKMYEFNFANHSDRVVDGSYDTNLAKFLYYGMINKQTIVENYFIPDVHNQILTGQADYTNYFLVNINKAYEACLGEAGITFWQYEEDVKTLQTFNAMADGIAKQKEFYKILSDWSSPAGFSITERNGFAYYVQAYKQMGEHKLYFDSIINYVNTFVDTGSLSRDDFDTKEADEEMLWWNLLLLPEQMTAWHFDNEIQTQLDDWYRDEDNANVIMIYGSCDPWTSMSLTDKYPTHSDRIHPYTGDNEEKTYARSHRVRIVELNQNQQDEIWGQLNQWLDK